MRHTLGIDPGLDGALAVVADGQVAEVFDMPTLEIQRNRRTKREVDTRALVNFILFAKGSYPGLEAWIEKSQAMPKQGASSIFSYGQSYGILLGALAALGVPVTKVHPTVWKKAMRVNSGKDGARQRASEIFPQCAATWKRKKDHGRAEAVLVAAYGVRVA